MYSDAFRMTLNPSVIDNTTVSVTSKHVLSNAEGPALSPIEGTRDLPGEATSSISRGKSSELIAFEKQLF